MSVYLITYHLQQQENHHECGCHEQEHHDHEHSEDCDCHGHEHEHGEDCGCGGDPDYDLIGEIECLGRWAQFMPTAFLVSTSSTSNEILEKLAPTIGERDLLFVTKVDSKDLASLTPQVKDWILRVEGESDK